MDIYRGMLMKETEAHLDSKIKSVTTRLIEINNRRTKIGALESKIDTLKWRHTGLDREVSGMRGFQATDGGNIDGRFFVSS
jgi:hypothetical protein